MSGSDVMYNMNKSYIFLHYTPGQEKIQCTNTEGDAGSLAYTTQFDLALNQTGLCA